MGDIRQPLVDEKGFETFVNILWKGTLLRGLFSSTTAVQLTLVVQ
jgi:hypothetical protein